MNVNADGQFYWDLVNGGTGATGDPITSVDPAGSVVIDAAGTGPLPSATWAWGALDYNNNTFESEIGTHTITFGDWTDSDSIIEELHVSAVLDTNTSPDRDTAFPSWGCFNVATTTDCP